MINYFLPSRAATKETLGHPAAGIIGWIDGSAGGSGVFVDEDIALNFSAYWAGIRVISETLATLPCILYERDGNDGKRRRTEDSRYSLVRDQPSMDMTASTFFEAATGHVVGFGNAYAKIVRTGSNVPLSMELRRPERTRMERDARGRLVYHFDMDSGVETEFADDVLHVLGFSHDGMKGHSVVERARETLGAGIAADKFHGEFIGQDQTPNGILSVEKNLNEDQQRRLREAWRERHKDKHDIAILHNGLTYQQLGMTNEDAEFLASRKFSVEEIARWLRLPPHMLGYLENSAVRANIEEESLNFVIYSMLPWLKRWETTLGWRLLSSSERRRGAGGMFFEFLVDSLLRGNIRDRYEAHAIARQWGWLSVNDIRRQENMDPLGPEGDVYLQPLNMIEAGTELPASIGDEVRSNVTSAISGVLEEAKGIKSAMMTADSFESFGDKLQDVYERASESLQARLSTVRADTDAIRKEIATIDSRPSQVAIKDDVSEKLRGSLQESALKQIQSTCQVLMRKEAAQVVKFARRAANSGENFVSLVDEFYSKLNPASAYDLACEGWAIAHGDDKGLRLAGLVAFHEQNKNAILDAAITDLSGLEASVQAVVDTWEARHMEIGK